MPSVRVVCEGGNRRYSSWLAAELGWVRTADGASIYIHPDDMWVEKKIKGIGRSAGPKGTI